MGFGLPKFFPLGLRRQRMMQPLFFPPVKGESK